MVYRRPDIAHFDGLKLESERKCHLMRFYHGQGVVLQISDKNGAHVWPISEKIIKTKKKPAGNTRKEPHEKDMTVILVEFAVQK